MNKENRKLLDEVISSRLEYVSTYTDADDNETEAFRQAMEAIDRQIKISELDASADEQVKKQDQSKEEAKKDRLVKLVEICAVPLVLVGVQYVCNMRYAKVLCNFEKDYTFTTSAGRAMSKFFNFKGKN